MARLPALRLVAIASPILLAFALAAAWTHNPVDAHNYWRAWEGGLYDKPWFGGTFIYSPVVAQLIWPLTLLPFETFRAVLMAASTGALIYLVGWRWAGIAAAFPGVIGDLGVGSPHLLIAAALVAGVRGQVWAWSALPLVKVTPAVAGLWLVRDRRQLVQVLAIGVAIAGVSFTLAPHLWIDWIRLLIDATGRQPTSWDATLTSVPLVVRLPLATLVAALAAWRGWAWLIPIAAVLALPIMWGASASMLLACWALRPEQAEIELRRVVTRRVHRQVAPGVLPD